MRIAISSGHGLYVRGASGSPVPPQCDEVDEARRIVERVAQYLDEAGVEVFIIHDNESKSVSENLDYLVDTHNELDRDLDVSVHLNCYDHSAHGTEVEYLTQEALASKVAKAMSAACGFTLRADQGARYRDDLKFLNQTDEPAILLECFFCDNTSDCNKYHDEFENLCRAIAESISGELIDEVPPEQPERPPEQPPIERPPSWRPPENIPLRDRPVLSRGDEGPDVTDLQTMLPLFPRGDIDGNFGPQTETAVRNYQTSRNLDADGICGEQTWRALYLDLPAAPPPPGALTVEQQKVIREMAADSNIARYSWEDRGVGPDGWIMGLALSFAQSFLKLKAGHPGMERVARANTHDADDVCQHYRDEFEALGMSNETGGPHVLLNIYGFLIGMAMRESSGEHCCGRDQSADNFDEDTCEAGMFQQSHNSFSCDSTLEPLMDEYLDGLSPGYLETFETGVVCNEADWDCYGNPDSRGYKFQQAAKELPAFSAEACAIGLRVLVPHWGPVKRKEVEIRRDAINLLKAVEAYVIESTPEDLEA